MTEDDSSTARPEPAWCHPTRAKDMLHGTALFVRDMLVHDRSALYSTYGIRSEEAAQSLRYVELAELRVWGIDEMQEAVAAVPNQSSSDDALRRRIVMAMRAEEVADFIHPGDAVLLLERSGLMLSHELRDAVVFMSAGSYVPSDDFSDDDENRLRRLLGRLAITPEPFEVKADEAGTPAPAIGPAEISTAGQQGEKMKKSALISKYRNVWPSVEADINNASRTELKSASRGKGYYDVAIALKWAKQEGKISERASVGLPTNSILDSPTSVKHTTS